MNNYIYNDYIREINRIIKEIKDSKYFSKMNKSETNKILQYLNDILVCTKNKSFDNIIKESEKILSLGYISDINESIKEKRKYAYLYSKEDEIIMRIIIEDGEHICFQYLMNLKKYFKDGKRLLDYRIKDRISDYFNLDFDEIDDFSILRFLNDNDLACMSSIWLSSIDDAIKYIYHKRNKINEQAKWQQFISRIMRFL